VLFVVYFLFRVFCWMAVFMDIYSKMPEKQIWRFRRPDWTPDHNRQVKPLQHVLVAAGLLGLYFHLAGQMGWIDFVRLE